MLISTGGLSRKFFQREDQICLTQADFFLGWIRGWGWLFEYFFWALVYSKTLKFWRVCRYPLNPSHYCWICFWALLPVQQFLEIYIFFTWCHYGQWGLWFWFDIGLPYLAHGCITIRPCVARIHDPDMTLTFDINVKFIWFLTWTWKDHNFIFGLTFAYHILHMGVSP